MPDTRRTDPYCGTCHTRLSQSCGETGPGCGAEILPDWADVREAARNAGWRIDRTPKGLSFSDRILWDGIGPDAKPGTRNLCVVNDEGRIDVNVWGPHGEVLLHQPTAAEVLAAARLVGLGGRA